MTTPTFSTRYLRQRYEDPSDKSRSGSSSHESRSNRFFTTEGTRQTRFSVASSAQFSYLSDSGFQTSGNSDTHSVRSHRSTSPNDAHSSHATDHAYSRPNRQLLHGNNDKTRKILSRITSTVLERKSATTGRHRRLSQDEIQKAEQDHERLSQWRRRVNKPDPASSGVYLHKRRSREEKGLSKEDIEASLYQADSYWQGKIRSFTRDFRGCGPD